ncbi:MAG: thioredoxin domain-containing protein [Patescibacteria group bacterium]
MNSEREKIIADAKREATAHKRKIILRRVSIWGGTLLLLTAMVWGLALLASTSDNNLATAGTLSEAVSPIIDHAKGNPNAKVVLVEYSDFQCPACASFYPAVRNLTSKYGEQIQFVYRYFPLPQHDKGDLSARAAEAAGAQGKFWEMHDKLFNGQALWTDKTESEATQLFTDYAVELGLDKANFTANLTSPMVTSRIQRDVQGGIGSNVDATPTFFLNGMKLTNLASYADLESDVAGAINETK